MIYVSRRVFFPTSIAHTVQREGLVNSPWFAKLKPSKLVLTINNLLADLLIRQTFFRQRLENSRFVKLSACQTFPLYGSYLLQLIALAFEHP